MDFLNKYGFLGISFSLLRRSRLNLLALALLSREMYETWLSILFEKDALISIFMAVDGSVQSFFKFLHAYKFRLARLDFL